nr:hypothetical protein [uncultured Rhodopila sp.]
MTTLKTMVAAAIIAVISMLASASAMAGPSPIPGALADVYWSYSCGASLTAPQSGDAVSGSTPGGGSCTNASGSAASATASPTPSASVFAAGVGQASFNYGVISQSEAYVLYQWEILGPAGTVVTVNVNGIDTASATGNYGIGAAITSLFNDGLILGSVCATANGPCDARPSSVAYNVNVQVLANTVYLASVGATAYAISDGTTGAAGVAAAFADPVFSIVTGSVPDPQDYSLIFSENITNVEAPEPGGLALFAVALAGLGTLGRRGVAANRRVAANGL